MSRLGEHAGLFLGQHDHPAGSVSEPLEHAYLSYKLWWGYESFNPTHSLRVPRRGPRASADSEHERSSAA